MGGWVGWAAGLNGLDGWVGRLVGWGRKREQFPSRTNLTKVFRNGWLVD